jgi:integrase
LKFEKRHRALPHFLKTHEIAALVEAALKHDTVTFSLTRAEHDGRAEPGSTRRYAPISPLVLIALLTGCRFGEVASMRWASISLAENEILLSHSETKTRQARRIDLTPTPLLAALLRAMEAAREGEYCVGGAVPLRRDTAEAARKRLILKFGAPKFTWHDLRRTCETYLTCAPAIYGGASAYLSAKRLGHSVAVAEAFYVGAVTTIDKTSTTLEGAMGLRADHFERAKQVLL